MSAGDVLIQGIDREPVWQLLRQAAEAMVIVDRAGTIKFANESCERLFRWPPGELVGQSIEVMVPDELRAGHVAQREGFCRNPASRPMGQRMELFAQRRDGERFPVRIGLSYVAVGGELFVMAVVIDTTELKRAQEVLLDYTRALERSNRELEQFASVASHDLQEPLRKIQSFGERLAGAAGALPERERDYLERMLGAARRMGILIEDLLSFSRVSTRAQPFAKVDLQETLQGVLSDLEVKVEQSGARIEADPLPAIEADPTQMRQLLQNLLGNALKFVRPGVPPVIRVCARTAAGRLTLTIEDNGIGFDPKYTDKLFNLFQRLHARGSYEGSGIGLAICRKIVDRHGGTIEARGKPDEGTTIAVELPLQQARAPGGKRP